MRSRRQTGTRPTASPMKVDRVRGTIGFTTRDEADGARVTNAPSYYERHERWKRHLSEEDYKPLIKCILIKNHQGERLYRINNELVQKLKCPHTLQNSDFNWLKKWHGYDFHAKQVHSQYLATLVNR